MALASQFFLLCQFKADQVHILLFRFSFCWEKNLYVTLLPLFFHFQFLWWRSSTLLSIQGPMAESLQQSPCAAAWGREIPLSPPQCLSSFSLFHFSLSHFLPLKNKHTLSLFLMQDFLLLLPLPLAWLSFFSRQRDLQYNFLLCKFVHLDLHNSSCSCVILCFRLKRSPRSKCGPLAKVVSYK